jgi:uncharacterized membrane protein YfcA
MAIPWLLLTGLLAGFMGGMMGVGGGLVMIPMMVIGLGLAQHKAQGISLAVILLPTALPAVYKYWKAGNIEIGLVLWISLGFIVGGFIGGSLVQYVSGPVLKKIFGVFLLIVSAKYLLGK